jgi:phage shock protein C
MMLTKSNDRMIAGVCGGIAEWLGWSAGVVRSLFILVSVLSLGFAGLIFYTVLAIVMPAPPAGFDLQDHRKQ